MEKEKSKDICIRLNPRVIMIVLLFAFAFFTRLYNLQVKALMHDECMFTYYSWHLYEHGDYLYQPILHGAVLQQMNALFFLLLGDSTYTMRLFPALCGLAVIFVLLGFRSRLGKEGMVAAIALFALSPFFMFYARFCRNDMPFALFSILTFYLYWRFFREGGGKTLVFAILSSMMLICIKENQLIYFFTIYTFAGLLFLVDVVKGYLEDRKKPGKKKKPHPRIAPGRWFNVDPLSLLLLVASFGFYLIGHFSGYYEFKSLGFLGVVCYLAHMFRRYYLEVKEKPPASFRDISIGYTTIFINALALVLLCWIVYEDLFSGLVKIQWAFWKTSVLLACFYVFLFIVNFWIRTGAGEDRLMRRFFLYLGDHLPYLFIGLFASCIIYIIFFSTWFKHPESPFQFYKKTFQYWMGQHKEHRIKGAFHYYLPILAVYELPALLIVIGGAIAALWKSRNIRRFGITFYAVVFIAAFLYFSKHPFSTDDWKKLDESIHMNAYFHFFFFGTVAFFGTLLTIHYLWKKERFNALLVYWSMGSILGYSYAGEKVPWVSVHIMLPILILAAVYIQKLWNTKFFRKTALAWYILFILFAMWNIKSSVVVSFINHSNIAERMIYSHASMDVPRSARVVKDIAFQLGTREKTKILVKGWAVWPMRWYLRDYEWTEWENPETTAFPIVIMDYDKAMDIKNITENYQISKHKVIQWWVPVLLDFDRLFDIWLVVIPKQYYKRGNTGQRIQNSKAEWNKIRDYLLHRKIYEGHDSKWPSVSAPEMALCIRKNILDR